MKLTSLILALGCTAGIVQAQNTQQQLDSVVISSTRIDLPFAENSRTIQIITAAEIKKSAATNVADLLQQVAGVDVRRRGTAGSQADLYIRGGSFDQTLLLIDGIKVEDAQTGHHSMNLALPIEVIERIEIIKGPAARVYGQNAFTGAVNIITKDAKQNSVSLGVEGGSFNQKNAAITVSSRLENSSHTVHYSRNTSDGYRYNTDYDNQQYFIKSKFNESKLPIEMIAAFAERKFGANGFYATPTATDQYEETQASLLGFTTEIKGEKLTIKPRVYWRRNQDEYIYLRQDPSVYRNLHISNKIGAEVNMAYQSSLGTTGFGVDLAKVYLSSNNLGDRNRFMSTIFVEHRFKALNNKLDITPGFAMNYFSDFKFHFFPGMDIGYKINHNFRLYGNIGYTYRIPTYTDLFYASTTTLGNANLQTEEALSEEIGIKFTQGRFALTAAFFNRDASKLIDYVKENEEDLWVAENIRDVTSNGIETNVNYSYQMNNFTQRLGLGYTFLNDDIKNIDANFSQYSINSLKHHFTATYTSQFIKNISQTIVYKYAERTTGYSYAIVDASINASIQNFDLSVTANNIFNTEYTETNLVPMPKGNVLFGLKYSFQ